MPFLSVTYVQRFLVVALLATADHWYTSRVAGRLLVRGPLLMSALLRAADTTPQAGLRVASAPDGSLIFESLERDQVSGTDTNVFWGALVGSVGAWGFLGTLAGMTLSLKWALLCAVVLVLGLANLVVFVRCQRDSTKMFSSLMQRASRAIARQSLRRMIPFGSSGSS